MKELSIEEKAKAYDEAIERAKKWRNAPNIDKMPTYGNRVIEEIFPELKESEDERIRKLLISLVKNWDKDGIAPKYTSNPNDIKQILAWLEKQGEQKSAEWSEDDEKMYRGVMAVCDVWSTANSFYPLENEDVERLKNWLKSLKDRYTWKPSDEQMKQLGWIAEQNKDNMIGKELISLYQDLKKLREE